MTQTDATNPPKLRSDAVSDDKKSRFRVITGSDDAEVVKIPEENVSQQPKTLQCDGLVTGLMIFEADSMGTDAMVPDADAEVRFCVTTADGEDMGPNYGSIVLPYNKVFGVNPFSRVKLTLEFLPPKTASGG